MSQRRITEAPPCAPPDRATRSPGFFLPPRSCDCHAHICGPASRYAYSPERIYTPPDSLLSDYLEMLSVLGVERGVLVQPSVYGTDNEVMIGALAEAGPRFRGVAVIDDSVSHEELERLNQAGVRGIRFNLVDVADPKGAVPLEMVRRLAQRVDRLGWHAEFLIHADDFPDLDRVFSDFPVDIVVGHMGYMRPGREASTPGFQALLRLMRVGGCWIKLTAPYRISAQDLPYGDVVSMARTLVDTAPERILWGSDWPHVMVEKKMPNDGDLCQLLIDWIPDRGTRTRVLVDNPAKLYGFD